MPELYTPSNDFIDVDPEIYFDAALYPANVKLARQLHESNHAVFVGGLPWLDPDMVEPIDREEQEMFETVYGPADPRDTEYRSFWIVA